ncbi:MAG TPA: PRC-barrel domain-containing protein, partial [Geobacteraceae bacterium]
MNTVMNELFFSEVLGKTVINEQGREIGKLSDLLMVPGEVFPEVSHLLVKKKKDVLAIPLKDILLFNRIVISVRMRRDFTGYLAKDGDILVKRDILDKQIVDVDGAKVVRVNDLKLGSYKETLGIFSVDIGFRGLMRRLGYERVGDKVARLLNKDM